MKKAYAVFFVLVFFIALGAVACKSPGEARLANNSNIPSFMVNPPADDNYIFGVGGAKMGNTNTARQAAQATARSDIAEKLKIEVQTMVINYSRNAGTDNNQVGLSFFESISRQLSNETLRGVEEVKWEQTADGSLWVLLRMDKSNAASTANAAIQDVLENEASRYAEFKAMDALKMMEEQLDKK